MPLVTLAVLIIIWCVMFYKIFHEVKKEEDVPNDEELDNWEQQFDEELANSMKNMMPAAIVILFTLITAAIFQ